MPNARTATTALLAARIAYGAALILRPEPLTERWLGAAVHRAPTQVALRGLGAREVLLHMGALAALVRGASVRPWLAASIAGDLTDIGATIAGRAELPSGAAVATTAVAGGSALLSALAGVAAQS